MFNKKNKKYIEINEKDLKALSLFESVDGNYNSLGFNITFTRVPGGIIRTIVNTEGLDQLFIPVPNNYFILL